MDEKTLFFDLDGTIIDSSEGVIASAVYALEVCGIPEYPRTEMKETLIGPPLYEGLKRLTALPDEKIASIVQIFRKHYDESGVMQNRLYEGMFEAIERLHRSGYTMHILTSKPQRFAERIIAQHRLESFFALIMGAGETDRASSKNSKIAHYLQEKGALKHHCIMIGDRSDDIEAAAANGIGSIAVLYGFGNHEELRQTRPSASAQNPGEIVMQVERVLKKL